MSLIITKEFHFSKVGIDEVKGLKEALLNLIKPIREHLKESVYWDDLEPYATEYKSRDGFIPYSHNCGGIELSVIIPKCEEYEFQFLEFGDCDECTGEEQCGYEGVECASECDGHLDARLRIWLKFEGINSDGELEFYFYAGGGNGDAPYFRVEHEATIFEESFSVKSLAGLKRKGAAVVKRMIKELQS